ncbi:MAG: hypothetical protein JWP29_3739 [Rhodoferax sp.]|nr:hypothetical protein [Rhodoferax sp.]
MSMFDDFFELTSLTIGFCQGSFLLHGTAGGSTAADLDVPDTPVGTSAKAAPSDKTPAKPKVVARRLAAVGQRVGGIAKARGSFRAGSHTEAGRTLGYKLYVPPSARGRHTGLVVMLHGCSQDPDDFARGTRMNTLARALGLCVLYPAQSAEGHRSRCWNWFKHNHQRRGSGEPAVIAGMTQAVLRTHRIDPARVYIAGMSAGGAMAATVAAEYPDLFAAAAVHSGLPHGAAHDAGGALSAMFTGRGESLADAAARPAVPTIVFHGDHDQTVHPRNGARVIEAAVVCGCGHEGGHLPRVLAGVAPGGRHYTRSVYADCGGAVRGEHWLVHGAGHAWSGGQADGSYTDATGPDASAEVLRFFMDHPRA